MADDAVVIGIDFGTDSVRSLVVNAGDGEEIATAVAYYPRWQERRYCDPATNRFRQHPLDHVEALQDAVSASLSLSPAGTSSRVRGIAVDTTGSTPGPVDRHGTSLALLPGFEHDPNAMFVLWKDHTAVHEAHEINAMARSWGGTDFTMYEGGVYSSEWFWAKMLHVIREDAAVCDAAFSWVEHCDWVTALLTGVTDPRLMKRSRCAAGHKAMWHESWGGLPSEEFLVTLDPRLTGIRDRLYSGTYTSDNIAGGLSPEWAQRLGLPAGIPVAVGAFDAHMGAVGGAIEPYVLSKIIGTSTCDILVAPIEDMGGRLVGGICGQVDGSVIPGMIGMEAGQSGFGDIYAWFRDVVAWPLRNMNGGWQAATDEDIEAIIPALSEAAAALPPGTGDIVALDWMNGRRTPYANQFLKGTITGLNMGSGAPAIFRALVEATAFGARRINERFEAGGVPIRGVIALGGVAKKSPYVMQVLADVLEREIKVAASDQTCALGAAMFAAVAGGVYSSVEDAIGVMNSGFVSTYVPDPGTSARYRQLYDTYLRFGEFVEEETTREVPS